MSGNISLMLLGLVMAVLVVGLGWWASGREEALADHLRAHYPERWAGIMRFGWFRGNPARHMRQEIWSARRSGDPELERLRSRARRAHVVAFAGAVLLVGAFALGASALSGAGA